VDLEARTAFPDEPVSDAPATDVRPARGGDCDVVVTRTETVTRALLRGDLETGCASNVERVLDEELRLRPALLEISLEDLDFLDSSGLRVFLMLQRDAERLDVPLRFVRPKGAVRRTLEFAKAIEYLGIEH
jgi:stage II sporulation protein AA (anti-sigma F factor antagonist)